MAWYDRLLRSDDGGEKIELREGSADYEWFVARGELERGENLTHGANHLANLLTFNPANPEWRGLLNAYLERADPDPESLIPRGEKLYFGTGRADWPKRSI